MTPWNRVKIIATVGPASSSYMTIKAMISAGLDIIRINFSHGNYKEYKKIISIVRKIESKIGRPIGILADMPGPKLRVRNISNPIKIKAGDFINIRGINISYPVIIRALKPNDTVFISDGKIKLKVLNVKKGNVYCKVMSGGEIKNGAGLNFPQVNLPVPAVTQSDFLNIKFALNNGVDFIGLSFIKEANDLIKVRNFLKREHKKTFIIAKIERHLAIKNLDEIIKVADGIMVARGDLGVEMPIEKIALLQKEIITKCNLIGKPVITATQMLESMIENLTPTRAEVSDIANAILDGTDAIMLSGETAVGRHPVKAVNIMAKICSTVEKKYPFNKEVGQLGKDNLIDIISSSVSDISVLYGVKAIIIPTLSGNTPRNVSRHKPRSMIIALTTDKNIQRQLTLSWGVYPCLTFKYKSSELILKKVDLYIKDCGLFKKGDKIIVTAGTLDKRKNLSNIIKICEYVLY